MNGISDQAPSPKALAVAAGVAPIASAAAQTISTALTENTQASGNHFSDHAQKRSARRDIGLAIGS